MVMSNIQEFFSSFWSATSLSNSAGPIQYVYIEEEYFITDFADVYLYPVPIAVSLFLFRYALERYGFCRLGLSIGLKNVKGKKAPPNDVLEKAFKRNSKWSYKDIVGLSKKTKSTERQIERWLRLRKLQDKPSPLFKFAEICWCSFYFANMFTYGLIILWFKPWLWDLDQCWTNHPYQSFTADIWRYYIVSLSFYWSLIPSQVLNHRQKDFWSSLTYNLVAVFLLSFSWICNAFRIGTVVLLMHDATDAFFYTGKVFRYLKYEKTCAAFFILFIITWVITRLVYFPFWILHSAIYRAPVIAVKLVPIFAIFKILLVTLFLLNMYWMYSVSKTVDRNLKSNGKVPIVELIHAGRKEWKIHHLGHSVMKSNYDCQYLRGKRAILR